MKFDEEVNYSQWYTSLVTKLLVIDLQIYLNLQWSKHYWESWKILEQVKLHL